MTLTGAQIDAVLEQQFGNPPRREPDPARPRAAAPTPGSQSAPIGGKVVAHPDQRRRRRPGGDLPRRREQLPGRRRRRLHRLHRRHRPDHRRGRPRRAERLPRGPLPRGAAGARPDHGRPVTPVRPLPRGRLAPRRGSISRASSRDLVRAAQHERKATSTLLADASAGAWPGCSQPCTTHAIGDIPRSGIRGRPGTGRLPARTLRRALTDALTPTPRAASTATSS